MALLWSIIAVILWLIPSLCRAVAMRDFVGSNDYIIVGVDDCHIRTEIDVPDKMCPDHLNDRPIILKPTNKCNMNPTFPVIFVPPDERSLVSPKLLLTVKDLTRDQVIFKLMDISFPTVDGSSDEQTGKISVQPFDFNSYEFAKFQNNVRIGEIIGVMYNNVAGELYILHTNGRKDTLMCEVLLLELDSERSDRLNHSHLYSIAVHSYFLGTQWSSDLYSKKFFYHKRVYSGGQEHSQLFSIPFGALIVHLHGGTPGEFVRDFQNSTSYVRKFVSVSNGITYSSSDVHYLGPNSAYRFLSSLANDLNGIRCASLYPRQRDFFFVLSGWEFCKLRHKGHANFTDCEAAHPKIAHENPQPSTASSNSGFLWWITVAIIANAVLLLLILCVLCKRKRMHYNDAECAAKGAHGALLTPEEVFQRRRTGSTITGL